MVPMGKRKSRGGPRKLTEFFTQPGGHRIQDGAGARQQHGTHIRAAGETGRASTAQEGQSAEYPSPSSSPQKSKPRLDSAQRLHPEPHDPAEDISDPTTPGDPIAQFPTTGQPIVDTTLKDMLVSLRHTLQNDICSFMRKVQLEIKDLGDRVDYVENKMTDYAEAHNELVDAHQDTEDLVQKLQQKVSDLEDRSRRNNLKLRGIPESVLPDDLRRYVQLMITTLIPEMGPLDVSIDRAHRLPKPPYLSEHLPRDVIIRIHFYQTKERLLQFSRQHNPLPDPYAGIKIYADLSQFTLQARKQLGTVTKALQNHHIPYKWGFPTKILITKNNKQHAISSLPEGLRLLRTWGIFPEDMGDPPASHPRGQSRDRPITDR